MKGSLKKIGSTPDSYALIIHPLSYSVPVALSRSSKSDSL